MLRLFTRESEQGDSGWFDLADVVSSLHLPQLSWTAEDIFVNVSRDPGLDVAELEQLSSAPHLPNPVLDSASFARLTEATHQFVDGEFVGFHTSDVGKIDKHGSGRNRIRILSSVRGRNASTGDAALPGLRPNVIVNIARL